MLSSVASSEPLPTPWLESDIGNVGMAGSARQNTDGSYAVTGGGADIWNNADAFQFAYQLVPGNATLVAQLSAEQNTNTWAKAGVMFRSSLAANSAEVSLVVSPTNAALLQVRSTTGATTSCTETTVTAGEWLRLVRTGSTITASLSSNGTTWTPFKTAILPTGPAYGGLAVTAHNNAKLNTATFDHVSVVNATPTSPTPPITTASPWSDSDIGAVGVAGTATSSSGGTSTTVQGGGADVWDVTDAFNFDSQPLVGDGSIVTQITGQTNTNGWAKAGVMIRESLRPDARNVMLALTPSHGIVFQSRLATHNLTTTTGVKGSVGQWLEVTRTGSTFAGLISTDDVHWTLVGTATIPMVNNVYAGLFVTAHDNAKLSTATFANTSLSTTGVSASNWTDASDAPMDRWEAQSFTWDNRLYVFGGFVTRSLDATAECDVYDPATDAWSKLTTVPIGALTHAGTALVGDTVYFVGGDVGTFTYGKTRTATSAVLSYDLDTNTWNTLPSLPVALSCGGLVAIGDSLYYYGGIDAGDTQDLSSTYALNLSAPQLGWTTKAAMPDARNHLGYAAVNGIAYAIGGQHLYDESKGNDSTVDAYNPATNTWTRVASLPQPWSSFHVSTLVIDNRIVIVGGQTNGGYDGIYQNGIEAYDPTANSWSSVGVIPEADEGLAAGYINGQLVLVGGTVDNRGGWAQDQTWIDSLLGF